MVKKVAKMTRDIKSIIKVYRDADPEKRLFFFFHIGCSETNF